MPKRQRTAPHEWSYAAQAWNASTLATQVTELTNQNEELAGGLETCVQQLNDYKKLYEEEKEKHKQYQVAYKHILTEAKEAAERTLKIHQNVVDNLQNLSYVQTATNQQQIASLNEEISKTCKENEEKIAVLSVEKQELQRQNAEERGRSKSWRVRYEKLVHDGAAALASKTVAEYGVTPCEVSLFKNFAQKQAAAAKATKLAQEAAIEATQMGFKTLEDA